MAERFHGNAGKAKAVFADSSQGFWREFDIPAWLDKTQVMINRRFHLRPLAPLLEANPRVCVCVVDRSKARIFDYQDENCRELIGLFNELPRVRRERQRGRLRRRAHAPGVFPNPPSSTTSRWRTRS